MLSSPMSADAYFMRIAIAVSQKSKCLRAKYGSILVSKDGRIVATGYNGKPRGAINDSICYRIGLENNAAKPNCCLHSEANCLFFASPEERIGATLYVSGIPCTDCLLLMQQSKISTLVYLQAPAESGHTGNFSDNFIKAYGMHFAIYGMTPEDL